MRIAVASGKGGTGKTLVATNLAAALRGATYLDCDVEGANGHLFLKPTIRTDRPAEVPVPVATDACTGCGACAEACRFGAIASLETGPVVFNELCHSCGACLEACPQGALNEKPHALGKIRFGDYQIADSPPAPFADGELNTGQVRASAVIEQVKDEVDPDAPFTVLDCPPGAGCAVAEALRGADLCLLVTEPTPFGLSDLDKAIGLADYLGIPQAVILNRSDLGGLRLLRRAEPADRPGDTVRRRTGPSLCRRATGLHSNPALPRDLRRPGRRHPQRTLRAQAPARGT